MRGFDYQKWPEDRIEKFKQLYAEGHSHSVIGARLGISRCASIGKAARLKLPSRKHLATPREANSLRRQKRNHGKAFQLQFARKQKTPRRAIEAAAAFPLPDVPPPPSLSIPFDQLEPHHCRYPYDEGSCGQPKHDHRYCKYHAQLCGGRYLAK